MCSRLWRCIIEQGNTNVSKKKFYLQLPTLLLISFRKTLFCCKKGINCNKKEAILNFDKSLHNHAFIYLINFAFLNKIISIEEADKVKFIKIIEIKQKLRIADLSGAVGCSMNNWACIVQSFKVLTGLIEIRL
ncbi:hypothetical protein BpHYR1_022766 [Brachionus plicatilis]|uniref:Uncharacterized protein n=1 Tax=Brachionus plicatilis TaxID=10195 RepID=A0A3M7Q803_BRAPC|nr:hypothetical protein BpHYR1_022766 [Brachionus plicatilis]